MAYMVLDVALPKNNAFVELSGPDCRYWDSMGKPPVYEGKIDGLPKEILDELLTLNVIKEKN